MTAISAITNAPLHFFRMFLTKLLYSVLLSALDSHLACRTDWFPVHLRSVHMRTIEIGTLQMKSQLLSLYETLI